MTSMIFTSNELNHFAFTGHSIPEGGYAWNVHFPDGARIVGEIVTLADGTEMQPYDAFVAAVSKTNGMRIINSRSLGTTNF